MTAPSNPARTISAAEPTSSFLVAFATMVVALVFVEAFYRSSQLEKRVRKSNNVTAKADEYAQVQADVVVTGDSRMLHGVIPNVVTETLRGETGKSYRAFNFGIPSGTTPIFLMAAHEAAVHRPPPRAFVIGVTPALFSCCDAVSAVGTAPGVTLSAVPSLVRATWWSDVDEAGASIVLSLFRLSAQRVEVLGALRDVTMPSPLAYQDMGWNSMGGRISPEVQDVRARGRAVGYADLMDKKKGAHLHASPPEFLRMAIAELQRSGVRVAVIGTPQARQLGWYHDEAHTYFEYLASLKRITDGAGVTFVDLTSFPGLENTDFVDGDHLSEPGARKFTQHLTREVIEPLLR